MSGFARSGGRLNGRRLRGRWSLSCIRSGACFRSSWGDLGFGWQSLRRDGARRWFGQFARDGLGRSAQSLDISSKHAHRVGLWRARLDVSPIRSRSLLTGPGADNCGKADGLDRIGPAERLIGLPHRLEIVRYIVGDALRVGHGFAAGDEAEIELIQIALHGDIKRATVEGDRHREIVCSRRADAIHRLPRTRNVRYDDIEEFASHCRRGRLPSAWRAQL